MEHLHPQNAKYRTAGSTQRNTWLQYASGGTGTNRQQCNDRFGSKRQQQNRNDGQINVAGETQLRRGTTIAHDLRHENRDDTGDQTSKRQHPQNRVACRLVLLGPLRTAAEQRSGNSQNQSRNKREHHVVRREQPIGLAQNIERMRAFDERRHP